jgi:hypothetical protein
MKTVDENATTELNRRAGRPAKPISDLQVKPTKVFLTRKQAVQLQEKASQSGVSISTYIRLKLNLK